MDKWGVPLPNSPWSESSFDVNAAIAEDEAMQEEEAAAQAQASPGSFDDPEDDEDDEEEEDYADEEEADSGMALGESHARQQEAASAASAASASGGDYSGPWVNDFIAAGSSSNAPRGPKRQRRANNSHIADSEDEDDANGARRPDGDGLDDRVERLPASRAVAAASGGDDGESLADGDSGNDGASPLARGTVVTARCFNDYNAKYMGNSITAKIPEFRHGKSSNSTWMSYKEAGSAVEFMRPVRTMCWNIPVKLFARHGTRFRHMTTPQKGNTRAISITAVLSFCFTGMSKGFLSGAHEEFQRANGDADEDADDDKKANKPSRVYRYAFMLPTDNNVTVPMFTIAYEELYNTDLTQVVAVRVWKFVYDKSHSDSELCRRLLDENRDTYLNAGSAHAPNASRRKNLLNEQKQNRSNACASLEYHAGMQYTTIQNEELWYRNITNYGGGHTVNNNARPFFVDSELPPGINNKRITPDHVLGGTHPLSPEYVFNARRGLSLAAGLVDFDDEAIVVHPDFIDPTKYWTDNDEFMLPAASRKNDGFFFLVNSYVNNVFDVALPRPIYGTASVGLSLLELYKECFYNEVKAAGGTNASAADCFMNMMMQQDPLAVEMTRLMAETVITYDSIDAPEAMRRGGQLQHYGEVDSDSNYIIEPVQFCKKLQQETRRVLSDLIQVWLKKREELRTIKFKEVRALIDEQDSDDDMDIDYHDGKMDKVREVENETTSRHCKVMKDLIELHVCRLEEAFNSKVERESMPAGYKAMYDGLQKELSKMPNGTASIAFAQDVSLQFDDMSSFAHMNLWLGEFWEKDTFVEGRDRRIMDEMFLHFFEQYGEVTFLLLLCGYKGNGKTLRTERAMAVFPDNWVTMGGPASAKAGQNGQSDSTDGKNVVYDEMLEELCESDGSDRLEYWKQIVLKREYTYNRTCAVKNPDGTETHRTMRLRTPHHETHLICTNYGMAFTKDRDPSDTKFAMIDRSIAHLVRSIGKHARTDEEFYAHIAKPEQVTKLTRFRIFVCLVASTKLAIKGVPDFQPSFALANKMFDYLDRQMIVNEYNLPRCTPRKSLKREENLKTLCIMKAVSDVFIFKQTAVEFDAGRLGEDGKPQPFKFSMLYDVIRQLRATPELIFHAWSLSLDYNIGTSAHCFAAMTAMCEEFGLQIGQWFRQPTDRDPSELSDDPVSPTARINPDAGPDEKEACAKTFVMNEQQKIVENNWTQLPGLLDLTKFDHQTRLATLLSMERSRRATSLYRHTCTLDGNSDMQMNGVIDTIEKIMKRHGLPSDMDGSESAVTPGEYLPVYPSTIMASTVQVCVLHDLTCVARWCADSSAEPVHIGNALIGTDSTFNFSEKQNKGPCKYSTSWLRIDCKDGWKSTARDTVNKSKICKIFDLPHNGLRDSFYLISTRDNSRRCTEDPFVSSYMRKETTFTDSKGGFLTDSQAYGAIRMRGVNDSRGVLQKPGTEELPRHPYAKMTDVSMQRKIDFMSNHGRFPAMMPLVSNSVRDCAPLRMCYEGDKRYIELSVSAAFEHMQILAESIIRCSFVPGMANLHERFCDDAQGPDGLCIASSAPPGDSVAAGSADPVAASSAGPVAEGDADNPKTDPCTKLPFSYDLIPISLTLDAMGRYYDDGREEYVQMYRDAFGTSLGFYPKEDDLPQMCMRFVGLADTSSRCFLSVPIKKEQSASFKPIEVNDSVIVDEDMDTMERHLRLSLGHDPTDEEIERYIKSRAGSRSMSGVSGDLLNAQTYIQHTLTTMKERGMISSDDDVVAKMTADDPYGLRTRVGEIAGRDINMLVDNHPEMKRAKKYKPPGWEEMAEEKIREKRSDEVHRVRHGLYKTMQLPEALDDLRMYAPLNVTPRTNMTFANREKEKEKRQAEQSRRKARIKQVDASSQFKDKERNRKRSLPGKAKAPTEPGHVQARGYRDSRKQPMRP